MPLLFLPYNKLHPFPFTPPGTYHLRLQFIMLSSLWVQSLHVLDMWKENLGAAVFGICYYVAIIFICLHLVVGSMVQWMSHVSSQHRVCLEPLLSCGSRAQIVRAANAVHPLLFPAAEFSGGGERRGWVNSCSIQSWAQELHEIWGSSQTPPHSADELTAQPLIWSSGRSPL